MLRATLGSVRAARSGGCFLSEWRSFAKQLAQETRCVRPPSQAVSNVVAGAASSQTVSSEALGADIMGGLDTEPLLPPMKPLVTVISGPSGVGKDAAIRALQAERPDLHFVVTATSRARREGEVDGVDYHFVTKEQFEEWIKDGLLLEHALVYGEYKGIPTQQVEDALARGTDVVLRIDVQGADTVRKLMPDVLSIFVTAETEKDLVDRLVARKTETLENLKVRVATARKEMDEAPKFDYCVVNRTGQLAETVRQLCCIIDAEKCSVSRLLGVQKASREA